MSYDLDKDITESFEFTLGGKTYKMRYPTTEEIEAIAKIKGDDAQTKKLFEYVSSDDSDAPEIELALKKANVKVLQRFREMLLTEMGVG